MALTPEQRETFDKYILELIHAKEFSKTSDHQIAHDLLAMEREDGSKIFVNTDTGNLYSHRNIRIHIEKFTDEARRGDGVYAREVQRLLLEGIAEIAKDLRGNAALGKVVLEKYGPNRTSDAKDNKPAIPRSVTAILQKDPVGTTIIIGEDAYTQGTGDSGHERPDSGDNMADGQQDDITPEALPSGHDTAVRGGDSGGQPEHPAQGSPLPDTEVPPQDTVDNDSGGDLGST